MADSPFELSVDSDWKQQAKAEKQKLAEEAAAKKAASQPKPAAAPKSAAPTRRAAEGEADFAGLVREIGDQVLLYLGGVPVGEGGRGLLDLDAAKRQIDLLAVLEAKTAGNLDDDERSALDVALYEGRSRFSSVASRYIL